MKTPTTPKKPVREDWHPAQVIAELRMRAGLTLSQLAKRHGVERQNMSRAIRLGSPINEKRIADALGLHPMAIWPTRYHADGRAIERRGAATHGNAWWKDRKAKSTPSSHAGKVNSQRSN